MTRIALASAALLAFASLAAGAQARPMTPEDVAKLESVGAIAVSPDGARIAYTSVSLPDVTEGEEDGTSRSRLHVATGPDVTRAFLPEDVSAGDVAFSPDGRMITFTWAEDEEEAAVWGIPVDGGTYMKLAHVEDAAVRDYRVAADGRSILMLVAPEADSQREAQSEGGFTAKVYEEENRSARLFRANLMMDGTMDEEPAEIDIPGFVTAFDMDTEGRFVLVETAPTPLVDDSYTKKRVNLIDLSTGTVTEIETPGKIGDVEISPDGTQLSLIAGIDMNDPAATTLHLVDVSSGEYRAIGEGEPFAAVDAEWLPDGRLLTVVHRGVQSELHFHESDGSLAEIVDPGELIVTRVEAAGGRVAFTANAPQHPSELFVWRDGNFDRWTMHNDWLSEITFGEQRAYTYNATDGQEVEGVLVLPVGGVPAGGAPTIMDVHGGPEAHESNGWVTGYGSPGHVAAGDGYAVFLPNYRGSTAYGTDFSKQHQGNYTDPEFRDIVDAKNALAADGITDPARTGITGGSYGGYASAWGATYYSNEFAASVMFVGISDQISKFGTTDIPYEMYNVHSRAWPWDDWQKMLEVSPIYYTDRAETPLLIMHGEDDTRVDPSQSMELYRFIKVRKPETPLRLVLYPGEGHGNRKAASRYDYNLRMMRWFDTYLKTGDRDAALPAPRPQLAEGAKGAVLEEDDSED
ncbi:S9 family peptidase [Erythrobacter sp.]|jgi:dipeptidyl aminopeptidase/acylaminoacyl peptidase|uniref:S9 family peptidase n=1 Tax=Erythrobacter sp. TaxID=1042 RepID=UPI002EB27198|nr:S9 family peptidase [Erythrobacter sp.]